MCGVCSALVYCSATSPYRLTCWPSDLYCSTTANAHVESNPCFLCFLPCPCRVPQVVMLVQTDVTARVELENKLADLTEAQLNMLEQLFPRHIIEYMLSRTPSKISRNLRDLANTHEQVMVLFCDVVDFTAMSKEVEPNQV